MENAVAIRQNSSAWISDSQKFTPVFVKVMCRRPDDFSRSLTGISDVIDFHSKVGFSYDRRQTETLAAGNNALRGVKGKDSVSDRMTE
jgi:hypothetical protein